MTDIDRHIMQNHATNDTSNIRSFTCQQESWRWWHTWNCNLLWSIAALVFIPPPPPVVWGHHRSRDKCRRRFRITLLGATPIQGFLVEVKFLMNFGISSTEVKILTFTEMAKKECKFCQATAAWYCLLLLSNSRKTFLATTYQPYLPSLYVLFTK